MFTGGKAKPKFTPKAPPKKEIVEPVAAPVEVQRYIKTLLQFLIHGCRVTH